MLREAEDSGQRIVYAPHLGGSEVSDALAQPLRVDRTDLFDEYSRVLAGDFDLGSKRCEFRAARRGRDDHDLAREHLVGLDDQSVSFAVLFVADALWEPESVDLIPAHGATP